MKPANIATLLNTSIAIVNDALEPSSMEDIATITQAQEAFGSAPPETESERLAMVKWLSLCTTSEQAREAYEIASQSSEAEGLARIKWTQLSLEEVVSAVTSEQIKEACSGAPAGSEAEGLAIRRLAEMPD